MMPPMPETCYIMTASRDKFGKQKYFSNQGIKSSCLFRENSSDNTKDKQEVADSDSMAWLPSAVDVQLDGILAINGTYFRVQKVIHARTFRSDTVQFIKCYLKRDQGLIS